MKQESMFDLFDAKDQRDLGMARAEMRSVDWIANGLLKIANLPTGYEGIGEEIRQECKLGPPPTSGAVGALIRRACERGMIVRTGKMRSPCAVKSHARETYVWRRT